MQRQVLIGAVDLVRGRVRHAGQAMVSVSDRLEPILTSIGYTDTAPFKKVSLILRFGLKTNLDVDYSPINRRRNDLPVAVELNMADLSTCNQEQLEELFMIATLKVLVDAGKKYNLPYEKLKEILTEKLVPLKNSIGAEFANLGTADER